MHRKHARLVQHCLLALGLSLLLSVPFSVSLAQTITSSGLNTVVSPSGQTQLDITGGTRPGGGTNLFHSFGNFDVPNNNIANFLNNSGLPTSNILGRINGGNVSNICGTIQTTDFGNANLFLMNPAGFLFGPNASLNVGGMVAFTSADYIRLADNARFNVIAGSADALLTAAPVAAFGFLGSNPGAITVQGSHLTVVDETGISLVGGNIAVEDATLTAPSGQINLVSVGRPSKSNVGGEVVIARAGQGAGFTPTGFRTLGSISLTQGSTVDVSIPRDIVSPPAPGSVVIRGGQFVMNNSFINASGSRVNGGDVQVSANQITLSNGSRIFTGSPGGTSGGNITFNANRFSATELVILTGSPFADGNGGAVTIQGLQGSGTNTHAVSLTNVQIVTGFTLLNGGPITIRGDKILLNHTALISNSDALGGPITLVSRGGLAIQDSAIDAGAFAFGGTVDLQAGKSLNVTSTFIGSRGRDFTGGSITMAAPTIALRNSTVDTRGSAYGPGGTISIRGTNAVSLSNGTVLTADGASGGTIQINGGVRFKSHDSTISAQRFFGQILGNGGTIHVGANNIELTDSQLNASTAGGHGGSITMDAETTTLTNSQILSTATDGPGGNINITSPTFSRTGSVIDASSQTGTDGTVTINGVIQP
jgi:filamentous hemagglutinin family protein